MSQASRARARKVLEGYAKKSKVSPKDQDLADLEDARYFYWWGDYKSSAEVLFPLAKRLICEPHRDTKEYQDGERKPETPYIEQEEEKIEGNVDAEERDEDGYLIR